MINESAENYYRVAMNEIYVSWNLYELIEFEELAYLEKDHNRHTTYNFFDLQSAARLIGHIPKWWYIRFIDKTIGRHTATRLQWMCL